MNYSEEDIRISVRATDFIKGREYFHYRFITEFNTQMDNDSLLVFTSKSRGNYNNFYKQTVQIRKLFGKISLHGNCSCPVGFNCKHVIAACLHYIHMPKVFEPQAVATQWMGMIKNAIADVEPEEGKPNNSFIIYRIYHYSSQYDQEEVKFYKTKLGKNGKLNKGTKIHTYNLLLGGSHSDVLREEDWQILGLCRTNFDRYRESLHIKQKSGYELLLKLVATGRCFMGESDIVLSMEDTSFNISFDWVAEDEEHSRLFSNLSADMLITRTSPPMIIDVAKNTLQIINNPPNIQTLDLLLKAPLLDNTTLIDVYETLRHDAPIPAPQGYSTQTLECTPTPHITLQKTNDGKGYTIYLRMVYGDYLIECSPTEAHEYIKDNAMRVEIIRDCEMEQQCVYTLDGFGFLHQSIQKKLYFMHTSLQSHQEALQLWNDFLTIHLNTLVQLGWIVETRDDFALSFEEVESIDATSEEKNDWFSLSFDLKFGGVSRPLVPLLASIITHYDNFLSLPPKLNVEIETDRYVSIDTVEMEPILKTIFELFERRNEDGDLIIGAYESHLVANLDENVVWKGSRELLELSEKLKNFTAIEPVSTPSVFSGTLRHYQQEGLNWLGFLHEFRFAGILADDMGLGKTIQTLCHLSRLKEDDKLLAPSLIIMPTSLIANWRNEAQKFTPNLCVLVLHGNDRGDLFDKIDDYDVILTTYPLITRDLEVLDKKQFDYIILDEAQKIKNPKTQMAQAIKTLKSHHRLALSGTPIENHLGELWSIFSFLMPGFLGHYSFFKEVYQNPIEKERDSYVQERFNRRIKPFVLRRTKEQVALELPPKTEIIKYTQFESKQAKLYETIRSTMEEKVREAIASKGLGKSQITILDALLKLRQVCCDPSLLSIDEAKKVKESAKLELLMDLLEELLSEGRKILLFSQFTSMLSIIENKLKTKKVRYVKLTGQTKNREAVIDAFSGGEVEVFLISLKAGGVGLNLIEADTVIHYDPWWNPAVENQATDRAYRIGQNKAVFVYKLIVENSIEQKILELQKKKQRIQNTIYEGKEGEEEAMFKGEELLELLKQ